MLYVVSAPCKWGAIVLLMSAANRCMCYAVKIVKCGEEGNGWGGGELNQAAKQEELLHNSNITV